jgi:N,N'-diacetyllegionaminate synthase
MKTKIIADFCSNHLGRRDLMEEGIKRLAEIGVDYVKFQTFNADKLNKDYPDYEKMHKYYKTVELSRDDHLFIMQTCSKYGIKPLFTAFDAESAYMIYGCGIDEVKIASPDADNWDLLEACNKLYNHMFISCGMISHTNLSRLRRMYPEHTYLYCISKYPTSFDEIDWGKVVMFDGFSDHTMTIDASLKAINLGVGIVERHFTLGKDLPGKDHKISSTVDEFQKLVAERDYVASIQKYKSRWRSI